MIKHPALTLVLTIVILLVLATAGAEVLLRASALSARPVIGWSDSAQGVLYGWGFDGGELVAVRNGDLGSLHLSRTNSRGWRDREHDVDKPPGVFRVLLLGDSNVFGFVSAAEETIGRQLERRLRASGWNAEVISLGYSGWGTDQEVEALAREGMSYRPDEVIIHFAGNDLADNLRWREEGPYRHRLPLRYQAGEDGVAVRSENPAFRPKWGEWTREFLLRRSELARRTYGGWRAALDLYRGRYAITPGQADMMEWWLGPRAPSGFMEEIRRLADADRVSRESLLDSIQRHGLAPLERDLLHIAESVNFTDLSGAELRERWEGALGDTEEQWRIYFSLVRLAHRLAEDCGARLALSSDFDDGRWQWDVGWHHVDNSPATKSRYFAVNDILRRYTAAEGIGFVDPNHPAKRSRNDIHPDNDGNNAVARNIEEYLRSHRQPLPPPP